MYLKTYMDIFSHIFKIVTPRALRQLLLFITLNCLTSAAFIENLCSHLIPVHYKTSTTCTSNVHFKIWWYIGKIRKLASNKVFYRCDWGADPDCTIINLCQLDMKNFWCHLLLDKWCLIQSISGDFHLNISVQNYINFTVIRFSW